MKRNKKEDKKMQNRSENKRWFASFRCYIVSLHLFGLHFVPFFSFLLFNSFALILFPLRGQAESFFFFMHFKRFAIETKWTKWNEGFKQQKKQTKKNEKGNENNNDETSKRNRTTRHVPLRFDLFCFAFVHLQCPMYSTGVIRPTSFSSCCSIYLNINCSKQKKCSLQFMLKILFVRCISV